MKKRLGERKGLERGRRKTWKRAGRTGQVESLRPWHQHGLTRVKKRPWGEEEAGEGRRDKKDGTSRELLDCWVSFTNRKTFDNTYWVRATVFLIAPTPNTFSFSNISK